MNKQAAFTILTFFWGITCQIVLYGQYTTPTYEIDNIKEVLKKEDFNSLSVLLKSNRFTIIKSNLNYNRGSQYVIAEIECEKTIPAIKSKYSYGSEDNFERLSIYYTDDDDYKRLSISISYYATRNDFLGYYYKWKDMNWTYVALGKLTPFWKGDGTRFSTDRSVGYEVGNSGSLGSFGNELEKVPKDSIKMIEYGDWFDKKPGYKKMNFTNFNENLGVLCDYRCELSNPLTSPDYSLSKGDTAYRFDLKMMEFYPKFSSKKSNQAASVQSIPLIKSGKTYFINISIGTKRKKYILDSGASDVTIDESTYDQLVQSGVIKVRHKLPDGEYQIADGSIKTYRRTYIPEIQIGNIVIENVVATIVPNGQPLLLGKSLLDNFKTWKIDNLKNTLNVEVE